MKHSCFIIEIKSTVWARKWPQDLFFDNPELANLICKTSYKRECEPFFMKEDAINFLKQKGIEFGKTEYPKIHELLKK